MTLPTIRPSHLVPLLLVAFAGLVWCPRPVIADTASDEQAIRSASQAYKDALEKGDGKALAKLWLPEGDIIDATGEVLPGRTSVEMLEPPAADAPPAAKPAITFEKTTVRFVSPDVALEDGVVRALPPGYSVPVHGRFAAVWVRHEGAWKLAAIRESKSDRAVGHEVLADLDWMIGDWAAVEDATVKTAGVRPTIEVSARWNRQHTFIIRDMTITPPGGSQDDAIRITQRIGWDPLSKSIRSWVFSSDGGHGEAVWYRDGDSWVARASAVLPDGSQTSSLNMYSFDGKDRCVWRSLPTHVGGEHMPQVNMTMVRKQGTGTSGGAR